MNALQEKLFDLVERYGLEEILNQNGLEDPVKVLEILYDAGHIDLDYYYDIEENFFNEYD